MLQRRINRRISGQELPIILCLDDLTCGMSHTVQLLREHGYQTTSAAETTATLQLAAHTRFEAVILNCGPGADNTGVVTVLRMLQPHIAVLMFSAYCAVPCKQLQLADACIQKGDAPTALLATIRSVLCQAKYGLWRSVAS
jgi:CheY-like chemotaxis protein